MKKYTSLFIFMIFVLGMVANSGAVDLHSYHDNEPVMVLSENPVYASDVARSVYDDVSESSYKDLIIDLTSYGPRPYGSDNNTQARNWIVSKLSELTDNKVEVSIFGEYESIIARLPGSAGTDGPCIMVGGHYDSVGGAPGANDDGTGVAAALELARVFSEREWPIDILFGFWNAEEMGLLGSYEAAYSFAGNKSDILAYYNVDMLLVEDPTRPPDERVDIAYYAGADAVFHDAQFWAELTRVVNSNLDSPIINPRPSYGFQYWDYSDHRAFQAAGYKSVLFAFESGTHIDEAYHTPQDVWNNPLYDYGIASDAVSSIGASIAFVLATTQGQKTMEKYQTSIPAGDEHEFFIEGSMSTNIEIQYNWTGSVSPTIELIDPQGESVSDAALVLSSSMDAISSKLDGFGMYTLKIINTGEDASNVDLILSYDIDVDGNGIAEREEPWLSGLLKDTDNDQLSDLDEEFMGTDKRNNDSDSDSLLDGAEINTYGTNPNLEDSDFDDMPDGFEVAFGLNPTSRDGHLDLDEDGLENVKEYELGSLVNDTDSDNDGMPDGWEFSMGLNPITDDAGLDSDGDLLLNIDEYRLGFDARRWDNIYLIVIAISLPIVALIVLLLVRKRIKA